MILTSPEQIKQIISEQVDQKFNDYKQQKSENDLMDVDRAAEFIGISKKTLYLKTSRKEIPFHRVPGTKKLWFSKEGLTAWIKGMEG